MKNTEDHITALQQQYDSNKIGITVYFKIEYPATIDSIDPDQDLEQATYFVTDQNGTKGQFRDQLGRFQPKDIVRPELQEKPMKGNPINLK